MKRTKELSLDALKVNLPKKFKGNVTQDVVDEINHLVTDPDYGEEFKESVLTHTSILSGKDSWSMQQYVDAVKFYSLSAMGHSQVDAYIKVFPNRLESRVERGQGKEDMRGEAARFNGTELVNQIRNQALVPLHLVNQGTTQLAINQLTHLMMNARSDVAKVSAATTLLKELKAPETTRIELEIGTKDSDAILDLKSSLADLASGQLQGLERGQVSVKELGSLKPKEEVIEVELDE